MFCAVDGMHLEVQAPPSSKRSSMKRLYNHKHKTWATIVIVVVDLFGRIIFMSVPFENTEAHAYKDCDLKTMLKDAGVGCVTDALYCFNLKGDADAARCVQAWTIGPGSLKKARRLLAGKYGEVEADVKVELEQMLKSTKLASQIRIVVENTIMQLRKYAIVRMRYRHYAHSGQRTRKQTIPQKVALQAVGGLVNARLQKRPPRDLQWTQAGLRSDRTAVYGYIGEPANPHVLTKRVEKLYKAYKEAAKSKASKKSAPRKKRRAAVSSSSDSAGDSSSVLSLSDVDAYNVLYQPRHATARQKSALANKHKRERERRHVADAQLQAAESGSVKARHKRRRK